MRDMQCWQCGVSIKPGQKLCVYCGAKLIQDGESELDGPGERGRSPGRDREPRRSSGGGGSRGGRAPEDDGWPAAPDYGARSDRYGSRERGRDDSYQPDEADLGGRGDGRSSRRAGGTREESRSRDPMDDPRAPRNLRGASSGGRSSERGRGGYENRGYDDAEYEYDDYNPRDRANPRYQSRFDPDSAEYDAVADQRRQSRVHPRQDESRSRGSDRDGGAARGGRGAGDWEDPRAGRDPREGRRREEYGHGQRAATPDPRDGWYGQERGRGYGGYGEAESAEYAASYDDRAGRRDRGIGSSRGGRGADQTDQQGYGSGGWHPYESRSASGFDAPAMGGPNAQGWSGGAWAPGNDPGSWAPPGAGYAPVGVAAPARKRKRGGLTAAVMSLMVVVVLAGGGYLARGKILGLLHRGGSGTSAPPVFATYTPGPTPTALPNYKLYVSTRSLYAIQYPTAWNIQNLNSTSGSGYDYLDTFQQTNPPAEVGIETAASLSNLSDDQIIASEVNGAKQGGMTFSQIGNDVTVTIGGASWTRRDYNVTTSNGVTLHMAILAGNHASHGYAIVLTAGTAQFAQDDSGIFKTMLSTFRFTS